MKSCPLFVAGIAACIALAPLSAQRAGSVEIGGFGAYPSSDNSLLWTNPVGGGGLLGIFFARNVSLEGDVSYFKPEQFVFPPRYFVSVVPLRARVMVHIPIGGHSRFMLGGGYVNTQVGDPVNNAESGITALAGFKIGMGDHAILRLEGTMDYHPEALNHNPTANNSNYGVRAGLGWLFGRYGSRDQDRDGVSDSNDRCPGTPRGATVDSNGCPDLDNDGVRDDKDRCAATPTGERVDATGCTLKDSDGDGVLDELDQCPETPPAQSVNSRGCALVSDSDHDGVLDDRDRCPDTRPGMAVDASGCTIDSDGDGITDAMDQCPNTRLGDTVDGSGCPVRDTDGDGVSDKADRCPNTPSGTVVGANGCIIVFIEGKKNVVLQGVNFIVARAELTIDAKKILNLVAQSLNANPEVTFEIQGHASSEGGDVYNLRLSDRRAASVRMYLISRGVAANRMTSKGYGEAMPIADNGTDQGRKQNRRVELVRMDK